MGATTFYTYSNGKTAQEAYGNAVEEAQHEWGHHAYNGTISTTDGFFVEPIGEKEDESGWYERVIDLTEKWGKCACTPIEDGKWMFAGWASC